MADALSDRTIELVKKTVPALEAGGTAITDRMYQILFRNQQIRDLFNQSHHAGSGSQSKALTAAIIAYARNIDNLRALASRVDRINQKHVGLNILPEHYHFVAEALLGAIKEVLGDAATPEILDAWGEAYWFLADMLIAREAIIYGRLAAAPGGWNGWRDFAVESVKQESAIIRSFVLVPADGGSVMRHRAGQYLTFSLDQVPGASTLKRNYSISSRLDSHAYRITMKREAPGRPTLWATTPGFLARFGLASLRDLPRREDLLVEPPSPAVEDEGAGAAPARPAEESQDERDPIPGQAASNSSAGPKNS